jgi:hypothetical protein
VIWAFWYTLAETISSLATAAGRPVWHCDGEGGDACSWAECHTIEYRKHPEQEEEKCKFTLLYLIISWIIVAFYILVSFSEGRYRLLSSALYNKFWSLQWNCCSVVLNFEGYSTDSLYVTARRLGLPLLRRLVSTTFQLTEVERSLHWKLDHSKMYVHVFNACGATWKSLIFPQNELMETDNLFQIVIWVQKLCGHNCTKSTYNT